jgi:hypothetical protein
MELLSKGVIPSSRSDPSRPLPSFTPHEAVLIAEVA